ncbi:hypothetical protein [Bacillus sp. B4-WWTP-NA-D-NA-NA]|uniref:hypothetical protein n=1 Tax=Bacillus sp. B4-WWTP-NA-D-NA-NA TaxID=2653216 RepID=UPI000771CCF1|nr:hypothetical protein [Bacillus sp. B4-WWTP-NA-D-NA-NA]KAB7632518.1 hypothetical protein GBN96_25600 [Bacillus sp. B4-WWTP-NA-D-NA-NA]KXI53454.1 hypothetical protein ACS45_07610 [Bacillus cereus]
MAKKNEMVFDLMRDVFSQHAKITIDEFDIAPEYEMSVLFQNDIEAFGSAIAHFLSEWENQIGQRGYINVQSQDLLSTFKYFNDIYVYFCLILEV